MKTKTRSASSLLRSSLVGLALLFNCSAQAEMVTSKISRGPRPTAADLASLASSRVKSVLNLQGGDLDGSFRDELVTYLEPGETAAMIANENALATQLGMQFQNIPLSSMGDVSDSQDRLIHKAVTFIADPANQPVFVHCEQGVDRTGLIIALYRVFYQHWTAEDAHAEWAAKGHTGPMKELLNGDLDDYFYQAVDGGW